MPSQTAELSFELEKPEIVFRSVVPDLSDSGRVSFSTRMNEGFEVSIKADGLGSLRGGLNTVLRLVKLSKKFSGDIDE